MSGGSPSPSGGAPGPAGVTEGQESAEAYATGPLRGTSPSPAKRLSGTPTSGVSSPHSAAKLSRRSPGMKRRCVYCGFGVKGFAFHLYCDNKAH